MSTRSNDTQHRLNDFDKSLNHSRTSWIIEYDVFDIEKYAFGENPRWETHSARGGTFLRTSRGGHDTKTIVDSIQDRGINQVYIIGGDGTQKGASVIYKEVKKRGLQVSVAGIPKTIDNNIAVIEKSFDFDTAIEEDKRAINAAHMEFESFKNGVGIVKLMGRYNGFIAMYATLASRDVDYCLIPESPFYLEGMGGLFEFIEQRLK
ncbi:hypothetical protein GIB67_005785 [Kingdonia uniflora]|uniref:Phosphofructokinase domain-containing protein n=1 Tax=Kingdonia uniflora TaxID=39325 RepID=A0A7J7KVK2_9MAGN|nr:hypothetical protein GIB67_005785 [Kingdonia uniflora]